VARLRQAAVTRLSSWSQRRHGIDALPISVVRRRIYIVPSRFGIALGALLVAMLLAGLNYNSNLGLAFGFLMTSLVLVAMHHCHRNLLGLALDVTPEVDAMAGETAGFDFILRNDSSVERVDIEIRAGDGVVTESVPPVGYQPVELNLAVEQRGVLRIPRIELRTRQPFGWFRAWTYVHRPLTAYVAPRPVGDRALPSAAAAALGASHSDARGDEDFAGLRAYEAGVPLKHMAWKVLARGGEPAVRSYTGLAGQPDWLEWDSLDRLDTEARLSQLCRWVIDSEASQRDYGLRLPGVEIAPGRGPQHRTACLRALAGYPHSDASERATMSDAR
jgi:uncharacterized protein (DUF58 family)